MKVVLLAGGKGTRLQEETTVRPKPMVEIGGYPILWHIMKGYAFHGLNDFVVALGYKGDFIKKFFMEFDHWHKDLHIDYATGHIDYTHREKLDWKVHLIDTGEETDTGGRLLRLKAQLADQGTFMLTYGDGVSNVNVEKLLAFHRSHGKVATMTAVRPPARFGTIDFEGDSIRSFAEKPQAGEGWINGGFFVFEPEIFDLLEDDTTILERSPLEQLAERSELMAFKHEGFWQCMDTLRDKKRLDAQWREGDAPWKTWAD